MALAYKIRDARTYEWDVSEAVEAGNTLRKALTEALAPQAAQLVREPLTDDDISDIWDSWLINITDKISAIQFAREIERAHHIGGDK
jgi:hypothetical protein